MSTEEEEVLKEVKELNEEDRCTAPRLGGKRCSRRRKGSSDVCGTHAGVVKRQAARSADVLAATSDTTSDTTSDMTPKEEKEKKKDATKDRAVAPVKSSRGIPQFCDAQGNVWRAEDVCVGAPNPRPA